jgi:opacity protein-like surface antigen
LARRNDRRAWRRGLLVALASSLVAAASAQAQDGLFRKLNIDNLEIQSLGISFGRILPSQVLPANIVGLQGDYGNILPAWRVVFGASYWESRFEDDVVQAFADSLQKSLSDPNSRVVASPIRLYDVTFSADARYTPQYDGWVKPFGGVGIAAHVVNAEGRLIKGTFVERSLDDIAAGLYATGGITLQLLPHFGIEASARGDLLSGFRSTQVKVGAAYILGHRRDQAGAGGDSTDARARERSTSR